MGQQGMAQDTAGWRVRVAALRMYPMTQESEWTEWNDRQTDGQTV